MLRAGQIICKDDVLFGLRYFLFKVEKAQYIKW